MPTYGELATEEWYLDEFEPPALADFNSKLRSFYGHTKAQTGSKGDNRHLRGRHRSINWDLNSRFCTNRSYATTDPRDRRGNWDALRATDIGITGATLRAAAGRLDTAVRAGRLLGLAEWFGTVDGVSVIGWFEGHPSSSDDSHLSHLHVGHWTEHADDYEYLALLYQTITGADDMQLSDPVPLAGTPDHPRRTVEEILADVWGDVHTPHGLYGFMAEMRLQVAALTAKVDQILAAPGGITDLSAAAVAELRDAVADLGEGGAAAVRADA